MLLLEEQETERNNAAVEAERMARIERRRARLRDVGLLTGIVSIVAGILFVVLLSPGGLLAEDEGDSGSAVHASGGTTGIAAAPTAAEAKGVKFERFQRVNPDLPATPAGGVKRFKVDVYEHVTKVSDELAPTEVWSYAINGIEHRGTGVSDPIVVEVGDKVRIDLVNGSSERMNVRMPHSIDYHSSEINPGEAFKTIGPGEEHSFQFVAKHPGVFMYHCATDPVLHHTGAGMVGAMIVKPKNLAPVDKELWITQQEFYIGKPGGQADLNKMQAKQPDVIAFNGYAAQYKKEPIMVEKGQRIRMFVMNAGPSIWSAFHVIGTVFDKTMVEGVEGSDAQTINLAPSQGGWVEFTLDEEGSYPFVTHAFGDMVKGSVGVLATAHAPGMAMKH
jgi:nitrite reductase (NO-forming)